MDYTKQDALMFFAARPEALPLYQAFEKKLLAAFPRTNVRVQKTQITFSNRHVYACISFQRVRKRADLPGAYILLTLGLPYPLESDRAAAITQPYPGRWTTHIVIGSVEEIDEELFSWISQAYCFAESK